jgi:proton-dependent oligopeptide transporter, POT family
MWERFSYYGMRAILLLYMVKSFQEGGLGFDEKYAGIIYATYVSSVWYLPLPGGWLADRILGARRAVLLGGIIIACGHFSMAINSKLTFYAGLILIACGTGLLKPNISAMVGQLYSEEDKRRDAGFSIFYMGINLGALVAPLIAGTIGEAWNWRAGFFCAGLFMGLGVLQYKLTQHYLGDAGVMAHNMSVEEKRRGWRFVAIGSAVIAVVGLLLFSGVIPVDVTTLAQAFGTAMIALAFLFFGYVLLFAKLSGAERKRVAVIAIFFLCAAVFWAGFEQQATTFNLFALDYTDRSVLGSLFPESVHPASWYQSANPIFVVIFAPVFAWFWVSLGIRNLDPSAPVKFGLGLMLLGIGFLVMVFAAELVVASGNDVAPTWLLVSYLLHTFGELCLSPVGLSNVTKLAPPRFVGQMMGTWFLGAAVGNLFAGIIGGHIGSAEIGEIPAQLMRMTLIGGGAGLLMLVFARRIRSWMGDIK